MHSAAIAEWVLSLVAAPDRAASTVGDLVEEVASRGIFWFWSNVLRTAGSHLWHDLTVSPLRMLELALWGVAASWVLSLMFGLLISMCTAWPLLVGWEVGRRSAGREVPAGFAVATLFAAIYVVNLYRASMQGRHVGITWSGMEQHAFAVFCAQALSGTAGAILFRRRTLAVRKSAC